jgi:hypothetical protein
MYLSCFAPRGASLRCRCQRRPLLVFLTGEALGMDDKLDWPNVDQPINKATWKLLRTESVDPLVDCFNRAISVETKRISEHRKIRKTNLLCLPYARKESRSGVYAEICKKPSRPTPYVGCGHDISGRVPQQTRPGVWKGNKCSGFIKGRLKVLRSNLVRLSRSNPRSRKYISNELIEGIFM